MEDAYQRSMETVMRWMGSVINPNKTQVFFRTYAPVHFRYLSHLRICFSHYSMYPASIGFVLTKLKLRVHREGSLFGYRRLGFPITEKNSTCDY